MGKKVDIVLPDGSVKQFDGPVSGGEIAQSIGSGLAKAAVAIKVNNVLQDLSETITESAEVSILTADNPEGLDVMRHTVAAQVLARAVKNLYPSAKLAIGPTIDNGFYYDVMFDTAISGDDLQAIEDEMHRIVDEKNKIQRVVYSRSDAIQLFKDRGEPYKVQIIEDTPASETEFGIYVQGDGKFYDLCRGPHLPSLKKTGVFKLQKVAGAYWRGDSNNEMLTRIYGTAWKTDKELKAYLNMMEEAEKRDHRKLGREMDLFHLQAEALGQVFWHDKGWTIFRELENYIRTKLQRDGYQEVNTPRVINKDLYVKSGHWEKFGTDEMFVCEAYGGLFAMKPMNCPCHVQIFNNDMRSYRDLPLRMSEFGNCLRQEAHGALHGLMRVSSMTQDDAHIFCTPEQIKGEVANLCTLIDGIYKDFGFAEYYIKFSDRPEQRVGSDEIWDMAEASLKEACEEAGVEWILSPGDGAFYGPKLEFVLKDAIGREWQCGTIQLDFNMPKRLDATYIDTNGDKQNPVMIHRALIGSLERFTGILIEHFAGHFPLWLAPVQVVISGIVDKHNTHAEALKQKFLDAGIRAIVDDRNEKINNKIREHLSKKATMIAVIGDKEIENNTVTVRRLGVNKQETFDVDTFIVNLQEEIRTHALPVDFE